MFSGSEKYFDEIYDAVGKDYVLETERLHGLIQKYKYEFGLFTREEYMDAFTRAGLDATHDPEGVDGRGLNIGTNPVES